MLLANAPVPVPSLVVLSAVVGVPPVFQQTPRTVTASPPSAVTLPPDAAAVGVMLEIAVVVTVGSVVLVVNETSLP